MGGEYIDTDLDSSLENHAVARGTVPQFLAYCPSVTLRVESKLTVAALGEAHWTAQPPQQSTVPTRE